VHLYRKGMARSERKQIVLVLVMMMVVVAQANDYAHEESFAGGICALKCPFKCKGNIFHYATCLATCELLCTQKTSKADYDCATNCVIFKSVKADNGIFTFLASYIIYCCQVNLICKLYFVYLIMFLIIIDYFLQMLMMLVPT